MIKMIQDKRTRDAIIMSSLVVFRRLGRRPEIFQVVEEARMPESAFYEVRESKTACTPAFCEQRNDMWLGWFQNEIDARYEATGDGLEIIADVLRELLESSQLRGSIGAEIVSMRDFSGQNLEIARTPKDELRRFVKQLAVRIGFQYPDIAACAAVQIIERTIVATLMTGDLSELKTARLLFGCLQRALSVEFN